MVALGKYFHHKGTKTRSRCCTTSISPGFQNRPLRIDHCSLIFERSADAYGNTLIFSAPDSTGNWWGDAAVQSDYAANEIIFCGYRFDAETQTYYVLNRYYGPALGGWLTRDPIGYSGGINLYGYVESAPVGLADSRGKGNVAVPEIGPPNLGFLPGRGEFDVNVAVATSGNDVRTVVDWVRRRCWLRRGPANAIATGSPSSSMWRTFGLKLADWSLDGTVTSLTPIIPTRFSANGR